MNLYFAESGKDALFNDDLISMVTKMNENQELHNFEHLAERSTELYEKMRKLKGKHFETDYLKKRRDFAEIKQKFKQERKLLSISNPQL